MDYAYISYTNSDNGKLYNFTAYYNKLKNKCCLFPYEGDEFCTEKTICDYPIFANCTIETG